jgi:hypothetical protein
VQVHDILTFQAKTSVIMAYGSSGAGKTFTITVSGKLACTPVSLSLTFYAARVSEGMLLLPLLVLHTFL